MPTFNEQVQASLVEAGEIFAAGPPEGPRAAALLKAAELAKRAARFAKSDEELDDDGPPPATAVFASPPLPPGPALRAQAQVPAPDPSHLTDERKAELRKLAGLPPDPTLDRFADISPARKAELDRLNASVR